MHKEPLAKRRPANCLRRRRFLIAAGALLAAPLAAAQQPGRSYRVGVLCSFSPQMEQEYMAVFRDQLARHGFVDGQNLILEAASAWSRNQAESAARKLLADKVDAIFVVTTYLTLGAQAATQSVPIVFAWVAEPMAAGIVKDDRSPGGNTTGVTDRYFELTAKRLELVRELMPEAKRVAVISALVDPVEAALRLARPTAERLGMELIHEVGSYHWETGIEAATKAGAQALLFATPFSAFGLRSTAQRVVQLAMKHRIPAVCADREPVEMGGLVSYATSQTGDLRRAADCLARVLNGEPPATLPVEQAPDVELALNLKTARAIGLRVPPSIIARANRLIE